MNVKQFLILTFFQISTFGFAQETPKKISVGVNGGVFMAGELNAIYGLTLGADVQYFFKQQKRFDYFLNAGYTMDINTEAANLYAFDLGIGTQFKFAKLWQKPLYTELSIGALYWQERFSNQLLDGIIDSAVSDFGFKANLGLGYQISNRINVQFNLTQFSTVGTTLGAGVRYSF